MLKLTPTQFRAILRIAAIVGGLLLLWYVPETSAGSSPMYVIVASIVGIGWILREIVDFPRRGEGEPNADRIPMPSPGSPPPSMPERSAAEPEDILDSPYRADRPVVDGKLAEVDFAQKRAKRMDALLILVAAYLLASFALLLAVYLALGDLDGIGVDLGGLERLPRMVLAAGAAAIAGFVFLVLRWPKK